MIISIHGRELPFPELDTITFREAGLIKRVTGLKMGQFGTAFEEGDTDMVLALALLALKRSDGIVDDDALLDTIITDVSLKDDDEDEPEAESEEDKQSGNAGAVEEAADAAPKKKTAAKSQS